MNERKFQDLSNMMRRRTTVQKNALEAVLAQLPSYKSKDTKIDPMRILHCSYLRLSKNNVETLENLCRESGIDPGIHYHMSQQEVEEYYAKKDSLEKKMDRLSETSTYSSFISGSCSSCGSYRAQDGEKIAPGDQPGTSQDNEAPRTLKTIDDETQLKSITPND